MRKTPQAPAAPPSWLLPALIGMAAILLLGLFSPELTDPDFWWHLRTGQYIAQQHRLPYPDEFAWTTNAAQVAPGEQVTRYFNLTHEWLSQLWLYGLYTLGGFGLVVLWKAIVMTAICGLVGCVAARRNGSWLWGVAAAMMAAWLGTTFAADRPALLTFLFVALFIAIFELGWPLWLLPVLSLIWANAHGGFFLGWVVCAAYCAATRNRRVWLYGAAAVAVSALNPNGFRVIETLVLYRQSALQSTLIEWSKPYLWGPPYAFDVLLYAAAIVLAISWRKVRLSDWLLFGLFAAAALTAFRNLMLVGIVAPILIAAYFPWRRRLPVLFQYAALLALVAGLGWGVTRGSFFQLRAADWRYPAGAAQFVRDHHIGDRLFNTYEYGGYLMWRGLPVFVDGRALSETVYLDYRKILGSPPGDAMRTQALQQYGISTIVMNGFEYVSGVAYPLALSLLNQPEWRLVYDDPQAMVLVRELPAGVPVLDKRRILDHLDAECTLHIERDSEFPLCARTLGDLYLRMGDRERARRFLGLYLDHQTEPDAGARQAYQQLLLGGAR